MCCIYFTYSITQQYLTSTFLLQSMGEFEIYILIIYRYMGLCTQICVHVISLFLEGEGWEFWGEGRVFSLVSIATWLLQPFPPTLHLFLPPFLSLPHSPCVNLFLSSNQPISSPILNHQHLHRWVCAHPLNAQKVCLSYLYNPYEYTYCVYMYNPHLQFETEICTLAIKFCFHLS